MRHPSEETVQYRKTTHDPVRYLRMAHDLYQSLLLDRAEIDDRRMNWYLTAASAGIGGLVWLSQNVLPEVWFKLATLISFGLLLVGWTTYDRLNGGIVEAAYARSQIDQIRAHFVEMGGRVGPDLPPVVLLEVEISPRAYLRPLNSVHRLVVVTNSLLGALLGICLKATSVGAQALALYISAPTVVVLVVGMYAFQVVAARHYVRMELHRLSSGIERA